MCLKLFPESGQTLLEESPITFEGNSWPYEICSRGMHCGPFGAWGLYGFSLQTISTRRNIFFSIVSENKICRQNFIFVPFRVKNFFFSTEDKSIRLNAQKEVLLSTVLPYLVCKAIKLGYIVINILQSLCFVPICTKSVPITHNGQYAVNTMYC